jgi:hypothetical protein
MKVARAVWKRGIGNGFREEYRAGLLSYRRGHWFDPSSAHVNKPEEQPNCSSPTCQSHLAGAFGEPYAMKVARAVRRGGIGNGFREEYRAGTLPYRRGHWFDPSSAHFIQSVHFIRINFFPTIDVYTI